MRALGAELGDLAGPIANIALWAALSVGSPVLPTSARAARGHRISDAVTADAVALSDVFQAIQEIRLIHQVEQLNTGRDPDDGVTLGDLPPVDRAVLGRGGGGGGGHATPDGQHVALCDPGTARRLTLFKGVTPGSNGNLLGVVRKCRISACDGVVAVRPNAAAEHVANGLRRSAGTPRSRMRGVPRLRGACGC